ncbi:MAG: ArsA family ATPase [Chloroflexota bacterium]
MSELPSFLENRELRFIFFGGKGGTGKTTSASASALYLARQRPEERILVVSIDPAHSLGDSFDQTIGGEIIPIEGVDNLLALELDSQEALVRFKEKNDPIVAQIAERGTMFDREDIQDFLKLTLPGMDELMAIIELIKLAKAREYGLVVVDTAPAGHTVRMLQLPVQMKNWVKTVDMMMDKYRYIFSTFTGRYAPDECDRFIEDRDKDIAMVERMLKNVRTTEFVLVATPEEMAIDASGRLLSTLKKQHIPVRNLIVNRVQQDGSCGLCMRRQAEQARPLAEIQERFAGLHLWPVPRLPHEVRGKDGLADFVQFIVGAERGIAEGKGEGVEPGVLEMPSLTSLSLPTARFILIGGKGGVGKTTVAAATAIRLASRFPQQKVLLFSTNPAHSVSDSLDQKMGAEVVRVEGYDNLYAQEIDAPKLLEEFIEEQRAAIDEVFDGFIGGGNVKVAFEQEIMDHILETTPPGLDEMMALMEIMKLLEAEDFDIFVLDTAATGHLIRFLEVPELAQEWFKTAARLLLKYRGAVKLGTVGQLVVKYIRQTRKVREQLVDPTETEFIVVTIPEAMGIAESERLIQGLEKLSIPCHQILINFVTPPTDCPFCAAKRREEQRYIGQVVDDYPEHRVAQAFMLPDEIRGLDDLVEFGKSLYRD